MIDLGSGDVVVVLDRFARQLGATIRDGVNAGALACTTVARRNYQAVLGPGQRLSGYRYTPNGARTSPRRVNPYYRQAESTTHPQALIAVRGPAQLVEHKRRGGYTVKNRRARIHVGAAAGLAGLARHGFTDLGAGAAAIAAVRNPAIATPQGARADAKPGPITNPARPFLRMVPKAPAIIEAAAHQVLVDRVNQTVNRINRMTRQVGL